jgi:hypothetical protein
VKPDEAFYLNPFVTREKGRRGYRQKRYRSNGTNTTIGGTHWRSVISLSNDDPRGGSVEQSREPTNRNRIQGEVAQGERTFDRELYRPKSHRVDPATVR